MSRENIINIAQQAKIASMEMPLTSGKDRSHCLKIMAEKLRKYQADIINANLDDVKDAREKGLSAPMIKRLTLDEKVINYMHSRILKAATLPDPLGRVLQGHTEASGLIIEKISVPIGVIAMIYESRPNVTSDAASVCIKSGNAVILRGGSESSQTNNIINQVMEEALKASSMPAHAIQMILSKDHDDVNTLLTLDDYIDVLIPRGGKALIKAVSEKSTIPVIKHYDGICHLYIAEDADIDKAVALAVNSKCQKVEVCNALETLLVDKGIAESIMPKLKQAFDEKQVELRGCEKTKTFLQDIKTATEDDWESEYLAPILSVKTVENQEEAHKHISKYGSQHTDAIATESIIRAKAFIQAIDSASVMVNASTRLSGGNDYGQGAVVGISTNKLHARGPVGPEDLTTYKWIARGDCHLRV